MWQGAECGRAFGTNKTLDIDFKLKKYRLI